MLYREIMIPQLIDLLDKYASNTWVISSDLFNNETLPKNITVTKFGTELWINPDYVVVHENNIDNGDADGDDDANDDATMKGTTTEVYVGRQQKYISISTTTTTTPSYNNNKTKKKTNKHDIPENCLL